LFRVQQCVLVEVKTGNLVKRRTRLIRNFSSVPPNFRLTINNNLSNLEFLDDILKKKEEERKNFKVNK
jgi:hypothetical protein